MLVFGLLRTTCSSDKNLIYVHQGIRETGKIGRSVPGIVNGLLVEMLSGESKLDGLCRVLNK
jgi:hypothetical protein